MIINDSGNSIVVPGAESVFNVEHYKNITTGSGNDSIKQNLFININNSINTGDGDDTIFSGLGQDTVDGAAGNDLLMVDYSAIPTQIAMQESTVTKLLEVLATLKLMMRRET